MNCKDFNINCSCLSCVLYRYHLIKVSNEIEELPADYKWDETLEFIEKL